MDWKVVLEKDGDTGMFTVTVPSLPECINQGKTREEALKNIKEAIELHDKSTKNKKRMWIEWALEIAETRGIMCSIRDFGNSYQMMAKEQFNKEMYGQTVSETTKKGVRELRAKISRVQKGADAYKRGSATISVAAEIAGLTIFDMEKYLVEEGYKSQYSIEDSKKEMKLLK